MYKFLFVFIIVFWIILNLIIKNKKLRNNIYLWCVGIILILIFGLRKSDAGIFYDYSSYKMIFENMSWDKIFNSSTEPLFNIGLCLIKMIFGNNVYAMFTFYGAIIIIPFFYIIKKYANDKCIAILLFLFLGGYFTSFNIMRQFVAAAIYILAIDALVNKELKKYIIWCLIAAGFHLSVILLMPLYFVYEIKLSKSMKIVLPIILFGILIFSSRIFTFLSYLTKYVHYTENQESQMSAVSLIRPMVFIFIFMYHLIYGYASLDDRKDKVVIYNLFLTLFFSVVSLKFAIAQRFIVFLLPFSLICIPNICEKRRNKRIERQWKVILYLLCFVYGYIGVFNLSYAFYWQ